jgi:hypothetical protein
MARTTPARTANFSRSPGERRLHEVLGALPDRMTVIHSQHWRGEVGERHGEGEADFLIIDPQAGLLVVEVKGGSIACDQGGWLQGRVDETPWKPIDPYEQANRSMYFLLERMTEALGAGKVLFGHVVWFPDADTADAPLPAGTPRDLTLDQRHLAEPGAAIEGAFAYWRQKLHWKTGCDETMARAMCEYLAPSFHCPVVAMADDTPAPPAAPKPPLADPGPPPLIKAAPATPGIFAPTSHLWGPALAWLGDVLLRAGRAILLAPVRFTMAVVDIVAQLTAGLVGWCWNGLKAGLMLGFVCGLAVGVVALVLRFGFHKDGAMAFVHGGFGGSFLAFVGHELGERLESVAADIAAGMASRWRAYRDLLNA